MVKVDNTALRALPNKWREEDEKNRIEIAAMNVRLTRGETVTAVSCSPYEGNRYADELEAAGLLVLLAEFESLKHQWNSLQDRMHADFVRRTELEAEREEIAALLEKMPHEHLDIRPRYMVGHDTNCLRCQFDALLSRIQRTISEAPCSNREYEEAWAEHDKIMGFKPPAQEKPMSNGERARDLLLRCWAITHYGKPFIGDVILVAAEFDNVEREAVKKGTYIHDSLK